MKNTCDNFSCGREILTVSDEEAYKRSHYCLECEEEMYEYMAGEEKKTNPSWYELWMQTIKRI
jgi:hypothetical protein